MKDKENMKYEKELNELKEKELEEKNTYSFFNKINDYVF